MTMILTAQTVAADLAPAGQYQALILIQACNLNRCHNREEEASEKPVLTDFLATVITMDSTFTFPYFTSI